MDSIDRRNLLTGASIAGIAGLAAALPAELLAQTRASGNAVSADAAPSGPEPQSRHKIRFGVIGLDHGHIYSMTDAVIRGGGTPMAFFAADPAQVATFRKRYPGVALARSEEEILEDKSLQLIVAAQTGNLVWPQKPDFEDFGDMIVTGDGGTGYVRVDWYTPDGLATWGDGRLFILGTDGYIELRKYIDPTGRPGGNHLIIADKKSTRYIDCSKVYLPFGSQFVTDIVERTSNAQDQEQALLAAELVLTAQKNATRPVRA